MKTKKKKDTSWFQSLDMKWRRAIILISIFVITLVTTMGVLYGLGFLFDSSNPKDGESSPSAQTTLKPTIQTGTVLGVSEDGGRSYLDSTLFLGDSNTVRFLSFNDTDNQPYTTIQNTIAVVGMSSKVIDTLACEQMDTGNYTMVEAVSILQPQRIIITFGTNDLDGITTDPTVFINDYQEQLKKIQEAYPSVDIIVNSIPPIGSVNDYPKLKPNQIVIYNEAIEKMCEENGWKYLNSYEALCDSDTGYARSGYLVSDGLHLSETGLRTLFNYIRTHAYITEDDRPQPIAEIPTIFGPMTNYYTTNPLNQEPFSEEVITPNQSTPEPTQTTEEPVATEEPTIEPTPTPEATEEVEQVPQATPEQEKQE